MEIGLELFKNRKKIILIENGYKIKKELRLLSIVPHLIAYILFISLFYPLIVIKFSLALKIVIGITFFFLTGYLLAKTVEYFENILDRKINTIPNSEIYSLLKPLELKKYQIKANDFITYINGFKFSESSIKFQVQKLSNDGKTLLFKDMDGKYKEVSVKDFFTLEYEV